MEMTGIIYPAAIMGGLGVIFGVLLAFASQKFAVEVDERQTKIREVLPGANCGGCGFPGCDGFAEAVVAGKAKPNGCAAGGAPVAAKIASVLGVTAEVEDPKVAFIKCKGTPDKTTKNCVYDGVADCREAAVVPGKGPTACAFGCMGLGTCVRVCQFGAMSVRDGLAVVDAEKCVGCGACAEQCPRGVIALVPKSSQVHVTCNSPLKGPEVRKVCSAGCIGCTLCVKTCPQQAISMQGGLAVIDYAKCVNCGLCAEKCPAKNIEKR
ncbi:MAG: RnfABCDGE type electron transport complex subunit B [Synergistaceae bacterium]|nr:RnfABCDGE type electron transport complex subunit B [Synergistaceae bacterium]